MIKVYKFKTARDAAIFADSHRLNVFIAGFIAQNAQYEDFKHMDNPLYFIERNAELRFTANIVDDRVACIENAWGFTLNAEYHGLRSLIDPSELSAYFEELGPMSKLPQFSTSDQKYVPNAVYKANEDYYSPKEAPYVQKTKAQANADVADAWKELVTAVKDFKDIILGRKK